LLKLIPAIEHNFVKTISLMQNEVYVKNALFYFYDNFDIGINASHFRGQEI